MKRTAGFRSALFGSIALTSLLAGALPARAQTAADGPIAQSLFAEARKLMSEGRYDEACPKLAESQRLDPATGTLLNLALCYEKQGKSATAWAAYSDVAAASRKDGNAERQRIAVERIAEIEPKLCRLSILTTDVTVRPDLGVKLDGIQLRSAALGTAVPVDPGDHEIEVIVNEKKLWAGKVIVGAERATAVVLVAAPERTLSPPSSTAGAEERAARVASDRKRIAYVVGATGLVAVGVGSYLGLRAKAEWGERNDLCPANACRPEAVDAADRARGFALAADGAFALGLVGLGIAAYLLLVPPNHAAAGQPPLSFVAAARGGQGTWRITF
jgi:hypothetical protein